MIVGALLDAGADFDQLGEQLSRLNLGGYTLRRETVRRAGLAGTKFHVEVAGNPPTGLPHGHSPEAAGNHDHGHEHSHPHDHNHDHPHPHNGRDAHTHGHDHAHEHSHSHDHPHEHDHGHSHHEHAHPQRRLGDIREMIDAADLAPRVKQRAIAVFERLAKAEAKVHGMPVDQVHFHEVGAVDSIVDIVGACIALELLGVDRVFCSAIPVGSGLIECQHGLMPTPAPATAELMRDAAISDTQVEGEATTPTAAALLTALSEDFGPLVPMHVKGIGYGAGTREGGMLPNLLRVFVGQPQDQSTAEGVVELAANLDDTTGQIIGSTIERLISAGCLDAWATPAMAKKSRPAWVLSVLCRPADVGRAEELILRETPTLGIRRRLCQRTTLERRFETVETSFGPIRVKVASLAGDDITATPEFEDCRSAAETHHAAVRDVIAAAARAWAGGAG
jgi:uncharacterized protein (TIGR00299 family) protein